MSNRSVFHCPIFGCGWEVEEPQVTISEEDWAAARFEADSGAITDAGIPERAATLAADRGGRELEAVFEAHNATHTFVEALSTIAHLQTMLAERDTRINELADTIEAYRAGDLSTKPYGSALPGMPETRLAGKRLPDAQLTPEVRAMRDQIRRDREGR